MSFKDVGIDGQPSPLAMPKKLSGGGQKAADGKRNVTPMVKPEQQPSKAVARPIGEK